MYDKGCGADIIYTLTYDICLYFISLCIGIFLIVLSISDCWCTILATCRCGVGPQEVTAGKELIEQRSMCNNSYTIPIDQNCELNDTSLWVEVCCRLFITQ